MNTLLQEYSELISKTKDFIKQEYNISFSPNVIILASQNNEHYNLLYKIATAIQQQLNATITIQENIMLNENLKLVIATSITPKIQKYLNENNITLFLLNNISEYSKRPELKRVLWEKLVQFLGKKKL